MYEGIKRFSIFSFVLAVLNIATTLLLLFYFSDFNFTARITWIAYTFSASIGFLLISWGLFNLCKELESEASDNAEYIRKLAKRIKDLENKV